MIHLVILLFATPAIDAAPQASAAGRTPKGVFLPNAMAQVFLRYSNCLDTKTDMSAVTDRASFKAAVERGIAACAALRADLIPEADAALARDPSYRDPVARARVVAAAFDTQDEIQQAMGDGRVLYESK